MVIIIFISTCCLPELSNEQYAHGKYQQGTISFHGFTTVISICLSFTETSCKLMLSYVETRTQTPTLVMTTLLFLNEKKSILITFNDE